MPEIKLEGELSGSKSHRVIDTVKVITTKSTILDKIYQNSTEVEKLTDKIIGKLIKIKNVPLVVKNENDILGAKTMLSGALGDIPVDGIGSINMGVLLDALFKNLSYILEGKLPKKRFKKEEMIFIKIPMQVENELEHQYNISDIEIGEVTLIGIYRGFFREDELIMRLNRFSKPGNKKIYDPGIESDENDPASSNGIVHYLDIIAIVQDISF